METAIPGVSYAVEVKDSDHPRAQWRARYGWYSEDEDGLARMRESQKYAAEEYFDTRIVKRTVKVEVVE